MFEFAKLNMSVAENNDRLVMYNAVVHFLMAEKNYMAE